ncbi:MAG: hypothetical protein AB7F66_13530 [Bacteriovoracia bacterium]
MKLYPLVVIAVCLFILGTSAFAETKEGRFSAERVTKSTQKTVRWLGEIKDDSGHTVNHRHDLKFVRTDTGDSYSVVDSPAIEKLHHETDKNYVVEATGEVTPKFLFWGGNLIITKFKVIAESSQPIPLKPAPRPRTDFHADRI